MAKKRKAKAQQENTEVIQNDEMTNKEAKLVTEAVMSALEAMEEIVESEEVVEEVQASEEVEVLATEGEEEVLEPEAEEEDLAATEGEEEVLAEESGEEASFLPESEDEVDPSAEEEPAVQASELEGTELEAFEAAEIEEVEFIEDERVESIIESILFASDRPVSLASIKAVFKGTNVKTDKIRRTIEKLQVEYAGASRGVTLEEVTSGYQLRTKVDNMDFLRRTLKTRMFKLSGPALEVLSIVAYKQPIIKAEIDEIRGVESGHLLRALMEKGLVNFEGKSDLPGRPMQYGTTRKFLEIFGLRNLKELPTLSQIDEILPEGIDEQEGQKLSDVTAALSEQIENTSYSQGEEELSKITEQLEEITTSSEFFEQEKLRQKQKRDEERAQNIREALAVGEAVSTRDMNWLKKYEAALTAGDTSQVEDEQPQEAPAGAVLASEQDEIVENDGLFEEEAPHIEDEIPFYEEADEEIGEGEAGL